MTKSVNNIIAEVFYVNIFSSAFYFNEPEGEKSGTHLKVNVRKIMFKLLHLLKDEIFDNTLMWRIKNPNDDEFQSTE